MTQQLLEICGAIDASRAPSFATAEIRHVSFYRSSGLTELTLQLDCFPSCQESEFVEQALSDLVQAPVQLILEYGRDPDISVMNLQPYLEAFCRRNRSAQVFQQANLTYDPGQKTLCFLFAEESQQSEADGHLKELQQFFSQIGLKDLQLTTQVRSHLQPAKEAVAASAVPVPHAPARSSQSPQGKPKNYYRSVRLADYTPIQLKDAEAGAANVCFTARICSIEETEIRTTKRKIQTLLVYDGTNAIYVKRFEGKRFSEEDLAAAAVGDTLRFYGSLAYDAYAQDLTCLADATEPVETEKPVDPAEEKRVELHMHTNMSEMDGVCKPDEIVKYVYQLGHPGVVITDHLDVQGFVKAYNAARKLKKKNPERPFKIGFGCEMNMAEDRLCIVRNPVDTDLDEASYVVFDLETTGLSCCFDHIIEFGAVRMKRGMVEESKQLFIKPPISIPPSITAKTKISDDMVQDAPTFAEAVDDLLAWIGDDVLVAHNATFDYYFLNEELRRLGRKPILNPVIDTLDLSRALLKERHAFRLGNVARYYHISYDEEVAHRADYDANTLANVFSCLLKDARRKGAVTVRDLQERIQDDDVFKKMRRNHVMVLARNQKGLKRLYQLVSISNTDTLAVTGKASGKEGAEVTAEPRILRSAIEADRSNLLIGTSCQNNETFELACNGDDARLEQALSWYDYVELQPLDNYTNLAAVGSVPDMERIRQAQKRLIAMARKLGKPLVADSDAHYCTPQEKIFRDVYIVSQGVGGVTHPLYIRNEALRLRTKNPDQHIRLTQEMLDAFAWLDDPQLVREMVITNPNRIFAQLEEIHPIPDGTYPPKIEGSDEKLKEICYTTMKNRYEFEGKVPDIVQERLQTELDSIIRNGFGVHYYIAHLLVKKSNEDGYIVGSRGSVGSSFTATMAGITEVNPLKPHYLCPHCHYSEWIDDPEVKSGFDLPDKPCPHCGTMMHGDGHNIPFQTFLGFHADKTPDIDLNFSNEYQAKAHAFIKQVFGEKYAYRAGTIGTVADKTAYGYVSGWCEKMHKTISKAYHDYLALGCTDVKRTTGQHPGGIVIIPEGYEVEDFTPIQYPANDPSSEWKTTHYDFHDIHDNILKFDILGHVDPTAMRLLSQISPTDPRSIPMNDEETLSLFYSDQALRADPRIYHQETGALGLPEFGTENTRRILEEVRPHKFSELVMISGLSHGTDVWRGNSQELFENGHSLEEVIACRDDIMTYLMEKKMEPIDAFRIMEDVRHGRGLTVEQAELMRQFQVPEWYIDSCQKIKYMFPKAHAVAYVIMAVRVAWYKVHEPQNFYIQFLSLRSEAYEIETMARGIEAVRSRMLDIQARRNDRQNPLTAREKGLYETLAICEEMYARGYSLSNVDLYKSKVSEFFVEPGREHVIIPPFTVIPGLGVNVAQSIVDARSQGAFLSKEDLLRRTQLSQTLLHKLESMGCLDDLDESNQISLF